jgi:hypothetical protein
MPPSRYNHDGARGKFNKRSSASTSSAHSRRHYYGEPSDTIASLAAELAIARAELDAKDSELADMRAALEDKNKDFANVNKKLCDVKQRSADSRRTATSTSKLADDIKIKAAVSPA